MADGRLHKYSVSVAFTGTRPPKDGFRPGELELIHKQLDDLDPATTAIGQGGCQGVDWLIAIEAHMRGFWVVTFLPDRQHRQWTAPDIQLVSNEIIDTDKGPMARNSDIVDFGQRLRGIALYEQERQPRSGTWAAIRLGSREGRLERVITLRPRTGVPQIDHYEGAIPV